MRRTRSTINDPSRVLVAVALAALFDPGPTALAQPTDSVSGGAIRGTGASAIAGTVVDGATGQPLLGAAIIVSPAGSGAIADAQGRFRIELPPGRYSIEVSYAGHTSAVREVQLGAQPLDLDFSLSADARLAETIVIVGARTPRSVTKSPVPIDVITSEQIHEVGEVETNQILRAVAPSYSANHQAIADGSDHVDPASLRGLGPDQVLVLINGKRRHSSALLNVNGTFGRGAVGTDLNAIPATAIERIEVLRDGASAQYGSDAIAGVVNVVLKESPGVAEANVLSGITAEGDGFQVRTGLNYGIPVGELGVVNVTGEFIQRSATDRSGEWTGNFYPQIDDPETGMRRELTPEETDARLAEAGLTRDDVSMDFGQSEATVGSFFLNGRMPFGAIEAYTTGGITYRRGSAAGFYRRPNEPSRTPLALRPDGFLPEIHPTMVDWSGGVGVRSDRDRGGFRWDLSATSGGKWFDYRIENSINTTLGEASPTEFDAGGFSFSQTALNGDVVQPFQIEALRKLALVGGVEYRLENYRIRAGEPDSYIDGGIAPNPDGDPTTADTPGVPGAQVFPGFQPSNEVNEYRSSAALYVGVETELDDRILIDVGGRFENYDDFGTTVNGKIAARVSILDELAVRGAASTGFRAPSLHQTYFNNTSTQTTLNAATNMFEPGQVFTARTDSNVAEAFGIPKLEEETSINASAGLTITPVDNLSITADGYVIDIVDRIVFTSQFYEEAVPGTDMVFASIQPALDPPPDRVQFFSNAVDTRTWGTDVVVDFWSDLWGGKLGLTGAGTFARTRVRDRHVPRSFIQRFPVSSREAVERQFFNREEESRLETAVPRERGFAQGRYGRGPVAGLLRANYWGSVEYVDPNTPEQDEEFGAKVTLDADVAYELAAGLKIAVGGTNFLNTYPDEQTHPNNLNSGQFKYSRRVSQFGTNGAFYYLRLQYLY